MLFMLFMVKWFLSRSVSVAYRLREMNKKNNYKKQVNPMKWTAEAETAIKKVPFFVRKKVRSKVEAFAGQAGKDRVAIEDVQAAKAHYMKNMDEEVKGYRLDACFGQGGCPHKANDSEGLARRIESLLENANLREFLKQQVNGPLKFHHDFKVTLSDCPNACSQPQIKDIGIIGAAVPAVTDAECSMCGACETACKDCAVSLDACAGKPVIDWERCLSCGQCAKVCPTGAIAVDRYGYRVLLGGKLGRHPRLADELPGIYDEDSVVAIVQWCIDEYKRGSTKGKRFAELVAEDEGLIKRLLEDIGDGRFVNRPYSVRPLCNGHS